MPVLKLDEKNSLYYETYGKGEPVLFLGGLLANTAIWKNSIISELENDFNCILLEFRGQDKSFCQDEFTYEDLIQDIYRLTEHLKLGKIHIVGDAFGASSALSFAHDFPNSVSKIVLSSAASLMDYNLLLKLKSFRTVLEKSDLNVFYEVLYPNIYSHSYIEAHLNEFDAKKELTIKNKEKTQLLKLLDALLNRKINRDVSKVKHKTGIIHGKHDNMIHLKHGQNLSQKLVNSVYEEIDAGHVIFVERPKEYCAFVKKILI